MFRLDLYQIDVKPLRQILFNIHPHIHSNTCPPPPPLFFWPHTPAAQYTSTICSAKTSRNILLCSLWKPVGHYNTVHARCLLQLYSIFGTWLQIVQTNTPKLNPTTVFSNRTPLHLSVVQLARSPVIASLLSSAAFSSAVHVHTITSYSMALYIEYSIRVERLWHGLP